MLLVVHLRWPIQNIFLHHEALEILQHITTNSYRHINIIRREFLGLRHN